MLFCVLMPSPQRKHSKSANPQAEFPHGVSDTICDRTTGYWCGGGGAEDLCRASRTKPGDRGIACFLFFFLNLHKNVSLLTLFTASLSPWKSGQCGDIRQHMHGAIPIHSSQRAALSPQQPGHFPLCKCRHFLSFPKINIYKVIICWELF